MSPRRQVTRLNRPAGGLILACLLAFPALAANSQAPAGPATAGAPTPLKEPHALTAQQQGGQQAKSKPEKRATPPTPVPRPVTGNPEKKPAPAQTQTAAKPKSRTSAPKQAAAKPKAAPRKQADRSALHPRPMARRRARAGREARNDFARPYHDEYAYGGPIYEPPSGRALPPLPGCDEACQYRDWLNRYAAWYRDFGRYYGARPPEPVAPPGPVPPAPSYSENRPAPKEPPAYRYGESERARLDPWHGYDGHDGPANGY
jgi:hypothetical protein